MQWECRYTAWLAPQSAGSSGGLLVRNMGGWLAPAKEIVFRPCSVRAISMECRRLVIFEEASVTILNIHLEKDRALVAINTQAVSVDGTLSHDNAAKIFFLPHASAVIAFRGQLSIGMCVFLDCYASFTRLDGLFQVFEGIVERRCSDMKHQLAEDYPGSDFVLLGWSPRWSRMVGMQCEYRHTLSTSVVESSLKPWDDSWSPRPFEWPSTSSEMAAVARHQATHAEPKWPRQGWRGDLTLAEITPESITFTAVKEFSR